jgi:glycosyltransferase involved in cell wall biosynthesis
MKIALFCHNYPPSSEEGGVSHYTQKIAYYLARLGNEIYVFTNEAYLGNGLDGNVHIRKFSKKWSLETAKDIVANLKSLNVDIINLQYTPSMYTGGFKLTWPYLTKGFHSTISFHTLWGGSKINYLFAFYLMCAANGLIATNSEVVYLLRKYFPGFLKKTCHIPIGSNIGLKRKQKSDQEKVKNKFSIKFNESILAYFGMAYPGKGMHMLFETAKVLMHEYNLNFKLIVIGGGVSDASEYIQEQKKLVQKFGLSNYVLFTGRIESNSVSELLNASDVVILPFTSGVSDRRGSLMAALDHNKAIVTTKPSIAIDLFKNGENMIWPDKACAENLAVKVKYVLQDKALRHRLEKGAKYLALNYQWEDIGKMTESFFKMLISNKRFFKCLPSV